MSGLPVLEDAFTMKNQAEQLMGVPSMGISVGDVHKSRRIFFFLNAVEHIVCQVKKSSNKLVKHSSKKGENWKTLKSNSENIPFLHIPRSDRCCILWLHISWILIRVQVNGKLIHFGTGGRKGVISTNKLFQTISFCQGDH